MIIREVENQGREYENTIQYSLVNNNSYELQYDF